MYQEHYEAKIDNIEHARYGCPILAAEDGMKITL